MDKCYVKSEERSINLENSKRLVKFYHELMGTLFEAVYLSPPATADQYATQLNLKKQAVKVKELALSSMLRLFIPYTVCADNSDFMYHIEDTVACPLEGTPTSRFKVFSVVHPTLCDFIWSYGKSPYPLVHVDEDDIRSSIIRNIYERLADFIEESNYTMYNPKRKWGFWKEMIICTNSTEEALVVLYVSVRFRKIITRKKIKQLCMELREDFQKAERRIVNLVSLQMNVHWREENKFERFTILGDGFLYENVGDFKVKMFGESKFFSNQYGVDTIMKTMINLADLNHSWVAVNFGTFLEIEILYQSQVCREVFAICSSQQSAASIEDSVIENSITNVTTTTTYDKDKGVSEILNDVLKINLKEDKSVCVFVNGCLDNKRDVPILLSSRNVKKIIWFCDGLSSNTQQSFILLAQEKPEECIEPFILVKSASVDTSPYSHCVTSMYLFLRTSLCMDQLVRSSLYSEDNVNKCLSILCSIRKNKRKRCTGKNIKRKLARYDSDDSSFVFI